MEIIYHKPKELFITVNAEMETIPSVELFNKPEYQKTIEKWCTAMFGLGYEKFVYKCLVGINETIQHDVDFYLLSKNREYQFQITEVQEIGRRRGSEYKRIEKGTKMTYRLGGKINGSEWIHRGIEKKVNKKYSKSENLNLLIYANFFAPDLKYEEVKSGCMEFKNNFASIWILTNSHICSLFSSSDLGEVLEWSKIITQ